MLAPADRDRERLGPQPRPLARAARDLAHELLELLALRLGVGLAVAALDVGQHALVGRPVGALSPVPVLVADVDLLVAAGEQHVALLLEQLLPNGVSRAKPCASATASSTRFQYSSVALAHGASAPSRTERSGSGTTSSASTSSRVPSPSHVGQAPYGELNEKLRGASSSKERPQYVHASDCEKFWISSRPVVGLHRDRRDALGQLERGLDGVGDAPADVGLRDEAVDHHLDRVLVGLGQPDRLGQLAHLAVDPRPREPLACELVEQLPVLALAPAHDRRQDLEARALGQLHDLVDDLIGRLAPDRAPAVGAVRMADPGVEHPQVVVDLGDGAHRGPRVARGGLLVDRDRRARAPR